MILHPEALCKLSGENNGRREPVFPGREDGAGKRGKKVDVKKNLDIPPRGMHVSVTQ